MSVGLHKDHCHANKANFNLHLHLRGKAEEEEEGEERESAGREEATSMKREGNVLSQAEKWKIICVTGIGNLILPFLLLALFLSETHTKTQTHTQCIHNTARCQTHRKAEADCVPCMSSIASVWINITASRFYFRNKTHTINCSICFY